MNSILSVRNPLLVVMIVFATGRSLVFGINETPVSKSTSPTPVQITSLPSRAHHGKLAERAERLTGESPICNLPEPLRGCDYVTIERGDHRHPGRSYSFRVNIEAAVYLAVFRRSNAKLPPEWKRTPYQLEYLRTSNIRQTDDVYVRIAPAGVVEVPPHNGKDGDIYGTPHLAIVDADVAAARRLFAPAEPVAAIASVSAASGSGQVYTVKQEGQTGWAQFTHGNVYDFTITSTSGNALVTVEAVRPSLSSHGEVRLKFANEKIVLGKWDKNTFPADAVLRFDASSHIRRPGQYAVEIVWTGGEHGLHTHSVTIDTRPQTVTASQPTGETAGKSTPAVSAAGRLAKAAEARYNKSMALASHQYLVDLEAAMKTAMRDGKLDEANAIRDATNQIRTGKLPGVQFKSVLANTAKTRYEQAATVAVQQYLRELDAAQKAAMNAGNLDEANAISATRKQLERK